MKVLEIENIRKKEKDSLCMSTMHAHESRRCFFLLAHLSFLRSHARDAQRVPCANVIDDSTPATPLRLTPSIRAAPAMRVLVVLHVTHINARTGRACHVSCLVDKSPLPLPLHITDQILMHD